MLSLGSISQQSNLFPFFPYITLLLTCFKISISSYLFSLLFYPIVFLWEVVYALELSPVPNPVL
jgi:hypothetical protein